MTAETTTDRTRPLHPVHAAGTPSTPTHAAGSTRPRATARAATWAFAWTIAFVALHGYWALGGRIGFGDQANPLPSAPSSLGDWLFTLTVFAMFAAGLALPRALVRPWGRRLPRRLLVWSMWIGCAVLTARGARAARRFPALPRPRRRRAHRHDQRAGPRHRTPISLHDLVDRRHRHHLPGRRAAIRLRRAAGRFSRPARPPTSLAGKHRAGSVRPAASTCAPDRACRRP